MASTGDDPNLDDESSNSFTSSINLTNLIAAAAAAASSTGVDTNAALAVALTALAIAVANLSSAKTPTLILDPHSSMSPYDLGSRSGLNAFGQAGETLDIKWDGSVTNFLLSSLRSEFTQKTCIGMLQHQLQYYQPLLVHPSA